MVEFSVYYLIDDVGVWNNLEPSKMYEYFTPVGENSRILIPGSVEFSRLCIIGTRA